MKSPVASLCLACSSVKNRVNVTMSVLIFSCTGGAEVVGTLPCPLLRNPLFVEGVAIVKSGVEDGNKKLWEKVGVWGICRWSRLELDLGCGVVGNNKEY